MGVCHFQADLDFKDGYQAKLNSFCTEEEKNKQTSKFVGVKRSLSNKKLLKPYIEQRSKVSVPIVFEKRSTQCVVSCDFPRPVTPQ